MERAGFTSCMPTNWGAMNVSLPRACIGVGVWYIVYGYLWILKAFELWFPYFEAVGECYNTHLVICVFGGLLVGILYIVFAAMLITSIGNGTKRGTQIFVWGLVGVYVFYLILYLSLIGDTPPNNTSKDRNCKAPKSGWSEATCFSAENNYLIGVWSAVWQWWPWWIVFTFMSSGRGATESNYNSPPAATSNQNTSKSKRYSNRVENQDV